MLYCSNSIIKDYIIHRLRCFCLKYPDNIKVITHIHVSHGFFFFFFFFFFNWGGGGGRAVRGVGLGVVIFGGGVLGPGLGRGGGSRSVGIFWGGVIGSGGWLPGFFSLCVLYCSNSIIKDYNYNPPSSVFLSKVSRPHPSKYFLY